MVLHNITKVKIKILNVVKGKKIMQYIHEVVVCAMFWHTHLYYFYNDDLKNQVGMITPLSLALTVLRGKIPGKSSFLPYYVLLIKVLRELDRKESRDGSAILLKTFLVITFGSRKRH